MNNGDDTAYYLHKGYRVVAIEADPGLAAQTAQRFCRHAESGRLTILNVAVAEKEGTLPFWICESHPEWSSFSEDIAGRGGAPHRSIQVRARPFGDIVSEYGVPYFVKIDIEGSDLLCVDALERGRLPAYLSIELSTAVLANLSRFRDLGFSRFKCVSQYHHLPVQRQPSPEERRYGKFCLRLLDGRLPWRVYRRLGGRRLLQRRLSPLRRSVDGWVFPEGASGPFGEDTRGDWLSFDQFAATIEHFQSRFLQGERTPFWGSGNRIPSGPISTWRPLPDAAIARASCDKRYRQFEVRGGSSNPLVAGSTPARPTRNSI